MEMTNKKMYMFICKYNKNVNEGDISIVIGDSFEDAVMTYETERKKDLMVQYLYAYGEFEDRDDPDYSHEYAKERFDRISKSWELGRIEPEKSGTYGSIYPWGLGYRTYDGGDFDTITVIELSMENYQIICNFNDSSLLDRMDLLNQMRKEHEKIYSTDWEKEKEIKNINESMDNELSKALDLVIDRIRYKREMFKHPSDSEEYKAAKKKVDELKKEINRLFGENDDMLINFKEKRNE